MKRFLPYVLATAALLATGACSTAKQASAEATHATTSSSEAAVGAGHDNLNAVLWVQTSAEYAALAQQAFTTAQLALDEAIDDPTWTASVEQEQQGNFGRLPPAIVLDVDETVLDNSAYQARLIESQQPYSSESWAAWTNERAAPAIAGALDYTKEAAARGVAVFYITNRKASEEAATRDNLRALGFPVATGADHILTRGEQEGWMSSDKTARRTEVAKRYRILQLVGDNLGDFVEPEGTASERREVVAQLKDYWGMRWIVLPNPTYGNWESALYGGDYNLSPAQQRALKIKSLKQ